MICISCKKEQADYCELCGIGDECPKCHQETVCREMKSSGTKITLNKNTITITNDDPVMLQRIKDDIISFKIVERAVR